MEQAGNALEQCQAVILIMSPNSAKSFDVHKEIEHAHIHRKPIIPVRVGIADETFRELSQCGYALGAATSIGVSGDNFKETIDRIIGGLRIIDIKPRPRTETAPLRKTIDIPRGTDPEPAPEKKKPKFEFKVRSSRWQLYLSITVALVIIILGALILLQLINREPPLSTSSFSEEFANLSQWTVAPGWKINSEGRLQIESQTKLGYLTDKRYADFLLTFQVKLLDEGGAAWALRAKDQENYYLFQLSGPGGVEKNHFLTYLMRDGKLSPIPPGFEITLDEKLKKDGVYTITIEAEKNHITHRIRDDDTGQEVKLGDYLDESNSFKAGSVGFRAVGTQKFAVDDLVIRPR
jgi:hypothetical protein